VFLLQCAQRKGAASAFGSLRLYSLSTLTAVRLPLSRVAGGGAGQGGLIAHGIARSGRR
jgi:hypothetical protein